MEEDGEVFDNMLCTQFELNTVHVSTGDPDMRSKKGFLFSFFFFCSRSPPSHGSRD